MTENALCAACAEREAEPVLCRACTARMRTHIDEIAQWRTNVATWTQIDPGTPGRDDPRRLALLDNPALTAAGGVDIALIAATDPRSHTVITDDGRRDPDDVTCVDAEMLGLARLIIEERQLATAPADALAVIAVVRTHADWLARHAAADEHLGVLDDLARAVRDHGDPVLGECNAVGHDGVQCGGPLREDRRGPLPIEVSAHTTPTHLACGWCGETWPVDAATLLGMLTVVDTRPMPMPLMWCADVLRVDHWTLRKWAQRGHVRRYSDGEIDLRDTVRRLRDTPSVDQGA